MNEALSASLRLVLMTVYQGSPLSVSVAVLLSPVVRLSASCTVISRKLGPLNYLQQFLTSFGVRAPASALMVARGREAAPEGTSRQGHFGGNDLG